MRSDENIFEYRIADDATTWRLGEVAIKVLSYFESSPSNSTHEGIHTTRSTCEQQPRCATTREKDMGSRCRWRTSHSQMWIQSRAMKCSRGISMLTIWFSQSGGDISLTAYTYALAIKVCRCESFMHSGLLESLGAQYDPTALDIYRPICTIVFCLPSHSSYPHFRRYIHVFKHSRPFQHASVNTHNSDTREQTPPAIFTAEEHRRYHWIRKHGNKVTVKHVKSGRVLPCHTDSKTKDLKMAILDADGDEWLSRWKRLFATYDVKHLGSRMLWHVDPRDRDSPAVGTDSRYCWEEISKHLRKKRNWGGGK